MAFSHFPSPKLEKLAVRKACRERFRIFCGALSGTQSSHGYIVFQSKGETMHTLFAKRNVFSNAYYRLHDTPLVLRTNITSNICENILYDKESLRFAFLLKILSKIATI